MNAKSAITSLPTPDRIQETLLGNDSQGIAGKADYYHLFGQRAQALSDSLA
jgi:hypothetical protein